MKFKARDERYLSLRRELSAAIGERELWSVVDQWPLYCGIGNLARFMAIADLLRETLSVPGHVAEFGSWRGANLMFMAKLLHIYDPHGCKVVHCFESFDGLQTFTNEDVSAPKNQGAYRGNYEELLKIINLYELEDEIVIHKGDILKTLPQVLIDDAALSFSFIYCDTDLYAPNQAVFAGLHPRLAKGGMFVMDEWNDARWPGESVAVREFMEMHGDAYEMHHVCHARQPTLALKKVR